MDKYNFIVLGSDQNAYGQVRAIHEITNNKVEVVAQAKLSAIKYSEIINLHIFPDLLDDRNFVNHLIDLYHQLNGEKVMLFALPCGDTYVELLNRNRDILKNYFVFPFNNYTLTTQLTNKETFGQIAEKFNLDHPRSITLTPEDHENIDYRELGNQFPVVLKATDSVKWLDVHFTGRKKAFTLKTPDEVSDILTKAYSVGYNGNFILQEFIPGGAATDRVLNVYVDQYHHVKMMSLGHPLLEDPMANEIGNYLGILPEYDLALYKRVEHFLEAINYTGFANFDIKLDPRDRKFKFFEINLRFGRSSFYVNLNGASFPQLLIDDYFTGKLKDQQPIYYNDDPKKQVFWLSVPLDVFKKCVPHNASYQRAMELVNLNQYGDTLTYNKDLSFKRRLLLWKFDRYYRKIFKPFENNN